MPSIWIQWNISIEMKLRIERIFVIIIMCIYIYVICVFVFFVSLVYGMNCTRRTTLLHHENKSFIHSINSCRVSGCKLIFDVPETVHSFLRKLWINGSLFFEYYFFFWLLKKRTGEWKKGAFCCGERDHKQLVQRCLRLWQRSSMTLVSVIQIIRDICSVISD